MAIAPLKSESESIVHRILNELSSSESQHYTDFRLKIGLKKTPTVRDNFIIHFLSRRMDANPSFLVIYEGRPTVKFVLRMTPPDESCTGLHDVEREYRIMRKLHEKGFPVPKPLYLSTDEDDKYFNTVFFIRKYVEGWNFTDASLSSVYDENGCTVEADGISASMKWKMLKSAVETLAQLHLYCGDDILCNQEDTDNGPQSIRSFWAWRVDLWRSIIPLPPQTAMTLEAAEFVKALNDLWSAIFSLSKRNKKSTFQEGFIHGDFNFRNLVFDCRTQKVVAVLDWEMACVGDVCCDLAEFLLCLLKPSQCGCSPNMDYSTSLQEFTCEEWAGEDYMKELVSVYLEKVNCTPQKLYPHLYFAMAVACARFAAIFLCANRSGYSGHECTPSCGLTVIQALLQAQRHFSHKYRPEQD